MSNDVEAVVLGRDETHDGFVNPPVHEVSNHGRQLSALLCVDDFVEDQPDLVENHVVQDFGFHHFLVKVDPPFHPMDRFVFLTTNMP